MYSLNTTTRYNNQNATRRALELLGDNATLSKFVSLVKARYFEECSQSYYEKKYPSNLDEYAVTSVTKQIYGYVANKDDIPEEYRDKVTTINTSHWWNPFGKKEAWHLNVSTVVEPNCKLSETVKYKNEKLGGLDVIYTIQTKINWDLVYDKVMKGELDFSAEALNIDANTHNQFSNERFHPPPSMNDIITAERKAKLEKLCRLLGLTIPKSFDILNVTNLILQLEKKLFVANPVYKVDIKRKHNNYVDKKHTFKAKYTTVGTHEERATLPKLFHSNKFYTNAVKLLGLLKGRLKNMFLPALSASALIIDKTGLAMFGEPSKDPVTEAFVVLLMGSMSYQKLFTIESQMHGGIDRWLKAYLDLLISERSSTTDFGRIFRIIPSQRTVSLTSVSELEEIYTYILSWLNLFACLFKEQWKLGVDKCVDKNMMVPRTGTTEINVNAWIACAGAWGNLTRYVRLIGTFLNKKPIQLFKVLKLTAGDQMKWAESAGKSTDPDCDVFKNLTLGLNNEKIMPWDGLEKSRDDFVTIVENACALYKVEPRKWLGGPVERTAENRTDVVSVCGVVVYPENVEVLKEIGAFGSKPYGSSE